MDNLKIGDFVECVDDSRELMLNEVRMKGPELTKGVIYKVYYDEAHEDECIFIENDNVLQAYSKIRFKKIETKKKIETTDNINPSHYKSGGIETIDYIKAKLTPEEYRGFLKGNIIKYASRAELKGGTEDYKKLHWYASKLVSEHEK